MGLTFYRRIKMKNKTSMHMYYFKENIKLFNVLDYIADLTIHIPAKGKRLIRHYGLYSSRSKGKNKENGLNDKFGVKAPDTQDISADDELESLDSTGKKKSK